jgi:tetratricopeptide (TPR) repeat protein
MPKNRAAVFGVALLVGGCANPINRVTMGEYAEQCSAAETQGRLEVAAELCRRAWINTRIGNLSPEEESRALYNYGRVLKKGLKLQDAEAALKRSLELEQPISGRESEKTGRRLAELATVLIAQGRMSEGVPYMEQLAAISPRYGGSERNYAAGLFYIYADELRKAGQPAKADSFEKVPFEMGVKRSDTPGG